MKFIHIADVHLGACPDQGKPWAGAREREIWDSFYRVLRTAKEQQVDFVLIAGDLFHRQPLKRELKEISYQFEKINPVKVVVIAGNHDYIGAHSYYRDFQWPENVFFFRQQQMSCLYFESASVYIYGLSYENYEITQPLYDQVRPSNREGCHILLAHGGDEKHIPIQFNRLADAGFDYVALGHIHKPEILRTDRMAYSGALEPIDKNDTGSHGYISGTWQDGQMHIQFVPFAKRSYIHLPVRMDGNMPWSMVVDIVREAIENNGTEHIYKVVLSGFSDPDLKFDIQALTRLGNIAEVENKTQPDYDFDLLYRQNKDNIIGMYIKKISSLQEDEAMKKKALYMGLHALLNSR